jgi:hypothetical protein
MGSQLKKNPGSVEMSESYGVPLAFLLSLGFHHYVSYLLGFFKISATHRLGLLMGFRHHVSYP